MGMPTARIRPIRRVVTGHDEQGYSMVVSDARSDYFKHVPGVPTFGTTDLWVTDGSPADNAGRTETCTEPILLKVPSGGSKLRVVEFPPDKDYVDRWDPVAAFASTGHTVNKSDRHPGMHRTQTLDYAIVLSGEIWSILDKDETLLRAGDVLIQRGTNHGWSNRSDAPCLVAFVMLDAKPLNLSETDA